MEAALRIHQLDGDPALVPESTHTAFEERPGTGRTVTGNGAQARDPVERVNDLFHQALAEEPLVFARAHVAERLGNGYRRRGVRSLTRRIRELFAAGGPPGVQFRFVAVDGAEFSVLQAADRQSFFTLPALDGTCSALQVCRQFLPGLQAFRRGIPGWTVFAGSPLTAPMMTHTDKPPQGSAMPSRSTGIEAMRLHPAA